MAGKLMAESVLIYAKESKPPYRNGNESHQWGWCVCARMYDVAFVTHRLPLSVSMRLIRRHHSLTSDPHTLNHDK